MGKLSQVLEVTVTNKVKIAPLNSLLFISDFDGGIPPFPRRDALIAATDSCVSVGCYPSTDGETTVTLGPSSDVAQAQQPAFDSELQTPRHTIVVSTVDRQTVLSDSVLGDRTRIRIWVNHNFIPNEIIVGFE